MRIILILILWLSVLISNAQDTIFVRALNINGRALNIDSDGKIMLIRLTDKILRYTPNAMETLDLPVSARFSWIGNNLKNNSLTIFHTELPLPEKLAQAKEIENLLPGFYTNFITTAKLNDSYFICYRGNVLEYHIEKNVTFQHRGKSVRHIFCNDSLRVISTYSGIYRDWFTNLDQYSNVEIPGTNYSNGELSEINGIRYLCQDGLYQFQGDTIFRHLTNEINNAAFRKLVSWNGEVVCQFNIRISIFDLKNLRETRILLENSQFSDIEVWNGLLYCSDLQGRVFRIHPGGKTDTLQLSGQLNDLCVSGKRVIVSGASGLYSIDNRFQVDTLKSGIPALMAAVSGPYIFFTNLEGLYIMIKDTVYNIVENVEFNKKALTIFNNYLYAGSIDGLYSIQIGSFENNMLPRLKPLLIQIPSPESTFWKKLTILLVVICLIIVTTSLWIRHQSKQTMLLTDQETNITPELISETIRNHDHVTTVKTLADQMGTSVAQLNRKLKPIGETPLNVMQKVKKEIAIEMHSKGASLEQISKRTGYSRRYIREHFFAKQNHS